MRLALFQPDIPQNLGAAIRLAACLGVRARRDRALRLPACRDRTLKRAALDYGALAEVNRHAGWARFPGGAPSARRAGWCCSPPAARSPYTDFAFAPGDTLLFGRESAGAPDEVHAAADARLFIPLAPGARSLNLVTAAAMALGEALAPDAMAFRPASRAIDRPP